MEADGLIGDLVVEVAAIGCHMGIVLHQVGLVLIGLRAQEPEEMVEALARRPAVERTGVSSVPGRREAIFTHRESVVTRFAQDFGRWYPCRKECGRPSRGSQTTTRCARIRLRAPNAGCGR